MAERLAFSNAEALSEKYSVMAKTNPARLNKLARDTGDFIVDVARGIAPKRTGRLARSISRSGAHRVGNTSTVLVRWGVSAARYGRFVEYGTGMHIDPRLGSPHLIYPRSAHVMHWVERGRFSTPYAGGGVFNKSLGRNRYAIFAKYTKGQEGVHFMEHALEAAEHIYVPRRMHELGIELTR